jgi:hypothetical protein
VTTWNPSDKGPGIALSVGNLQALQADTSGGTQPSKVRATDSGAVGQFFEITVGAVQGTGSPYQTDAVGISTTASNVLITADNANALMWYASGWVLGPGVSVNTGVTWTNSDVLGCEYHGTADFRFYKNGTLAYTFTGTLPSGGIYPTSLLYINNDYVTANFGATAWAHDPGGVTAWSLDGGSLSPRNITYARTLPALTQLVFVNSGSGPPPPPSVGTGGFFPDTIASVLAGRTVRCDFLVLFDFAITPMRVWQGFGTLVTLDTNEWQGIGQLGQISDLESSIGGNSPQVTFTLSGVDTGIIADFLNGEDEVSNREVNVYMQFFDENFACLDNPYVVWTGIMDVISLKQTGPETCTVSLSAETIFARRALAPLGNLTDREQQQFFPGDTGLSLIPSLMSKTAIWPVILPQQ